MTNLDHLMDLSCHMKSDDEGLEESFGRLLVKAVKELRAARSVIEAVKSVAAEDIVKHSLLCFVMGCELLERLDAYDAVLGEK